MLHMVIKAYPQWNHNPRPSLPLTTAIQTEELIATSRNGHLKTLRLHVNFRNPEGHLLHIYNLTGGCMWRSITWMLWILFHLCDSKSEWSNHLTRNMWSNNRNRIRDQVTSTCIKARIYYLPVITYLTTKFFLKNLYKPIRKFVLLGQKTTKPAKKT